MILTQMIFSGEGFWAIGTAEGCLSRVLPNVVDEMLPPGE